MSLQEPITMEITVPPPGTPLDQIDQIGRSVTRGPIATSGPITGQDLYCVARDLEKDAKFKRYKFEALVPIAFERLRYCQQVGYFHPDLVRLRESENKKARNSEKKRQQAPELTKKRLEKKGKKVFDNDVQRQSNPGGRAIARCNADIGNVSEHAIATSPHSPAWPRLIDWRRRPFSYCFFARRRRRWRSWWRRDDAPLNLEHTVIENGSLNIGTGERHLEESCELCNSWI
jgi:ribosomal protein S26